MTHTISIAAPTATANNAFPIQGTLSGYTAAPTLKYLDDPTVPMITNFHATAETKNSVSLAWTAPSAMAWKALPAGSTVTATSFSFSHPALAQGTHVTDVTDGTVSGTVKYTVTAPVAQESPEGTLVEKLFDPPIVDKNGDKWALTSDHHITINGVVDPRTGSSEVEVLYYHQHEVFQQNVKGTWYYTTGKADVWHLVASPLVTHFGVIAELITLKATLTLPAQISKINQIIQDVGALMP